jgi:hypothetical protein
MTMGGLSLPVERPVYPVPVTPKNNGVFLPRIIIRSRYKIPGEIRHGMVGREQVECKQKMFGLFRKLQRRHEKAMRRESDDDVADI